MSRADQLLPTLMYWREYRTKFHIRLTYGVSESPVCRILTKKTKLHPLSADQKHWNRDLSQKRIVIENIIRQLEIFRMLSERYRNRRKRFGLRVNLIADVYNAELQDTR